MVKKIVHKEVEGWLFPAVNLSTLVGMPQPSDTFQSYDVTFMALLPPQNLIIPDLGLARGRVWCPKSRWMQ